MNANSAPPQKVGAELAFIGCGFADLPPTPFQVSGNVSARAP